MRGGAPAESVAAYIAAAPAPVRALLRRIRSTVRRAAPSAREKISYGMPTLVGERVLVHYAAFKQHIGVFPPVHGDAALDRALERWRGPGGNLRFPLDEPLPLALIARIVRLRVRQDRARAAGTRLSPPRRSSRSRTRAARTRPVRGRGPTP